jgi:hypothetical protein
MMMKIFKTVMVAAAVTVALAGEAKLKGLPALKTYRDYNLKKNNVLSVKYGVFAPVVDGDKTVRGEPSDFACEVFFDEKGVRVKEIVYNIETGKPDVNIVWKYDEKAGTVVEVRTDGNGELLERREFLVNFKFGTVLVRKYKDIKDGATGVVYSNLLMEEELWTENPKKKSVKYKQTIFDIRDGKPMRQSVGEDVIEKPYTMYLMIDELTAPVDYTWLNSYAENTFKASNGKTKKEAIFDGSRYEYRIKSKLLSNILYFDANKNLKSETVYIYDFDRQKNWTQAVEKENDNPRFIVMRDIKYRQ